MEGPFSRRPIALANWKMAMTVSQGLAFVRDFRLAAGDLLGSVKVILCPPFTALYALSQELRDGSIELGAGGAGRRPSSSEGCWKISIPPGGTKSRGMRRTQKYAAVTRDEDNAADGGFPTAS
jgi:triosephosphate isomerase